MHSSGALPVLAITGFRILAISQRKPYILGPLRGQERASSGASLVPLRVPLWSPLWGRFLRISRRKPYIVDPLRGQDGAYLEPLWGLSGSLSGALSGASLGPSLGLSGAFLEPLWGLPGGFSGASLAGFSDEPVSVLLVSASVASPGASLVSLGREA